MSHLAEHTEASPSDGAVGDGPRAPRPDQGLRGLQGRRRPRPRRTDRLVLRPARALGVRQDHDAADGRRPRDADVRHHQAGRQGHHLREALPAPGQHRLPELRALPPPRHLRERRLRPPPPQGAGRRRRGAPDARAGRADQPDPQAAGPALRWPAAAGGAGAGADQQARGAAARRAARCPRPQAAASDADRAQADPDRGRDHVHPRHPRPGGGHDHGRHHRGDERRGDRADGCPRRALREPPHHLRGELPRPVQPDRRPDPVPRRRHDQGRHARGSPSRSRASGRTPRATRAGSGSGRRRC